jgi:tetratricopeptide (TPR) repeat protein
MAFHIRNDRAITLTDLERFEEARREYKACLEIAAALENRAMELQATFNLGEMAQRERRFEEAIDHLLHAVDLARALDDEDAEVDALGSLGIAYLKAERHDEAADVFHRARDL